MIAKILSLTLVFLVAILIAQSPCTMDSDCLQTTPQCYSGFCDVNTGSCLVGSAVDNYPPVPCDDGNDCTTDDFCVNGLCVGFTIIDLDPCDDGLSCTTQDICHNGTCFGIPTTCNAPCMVGGTCDPVTGNCMYSGPLVCPNDTCLLGSCDLNTGACVNVSAPAGSFCNDSNPCTTESCDMNGQCVSVPVTCPAITCQTVTCNPITGNCDYTPVANGSFCPADANLCTTESCIAGQCVSTNNVNCPAVTCGINTCNPNTGICQIAPAPNGSFCNDSNPCTTESCIAGQCVVSTNITCPARTCQTVTCNPMTGNCDYTPVTNGSFCTDGNNCTTDSCISGICVSNPLNCTNNSSSNPCQYTNGTCNPTTGQCVYATKPNGTTCDDGNVCTNKDKCLKGQCVGTNTCCLGTKGKCGICVSDCCSEYSTVLKFFGLRGSSDDVSEVSGGGCSSYSVCCAPISQSTITKQNNTCVARKP